MKKYGTQMAVETLQNVDSETQAKILKNLEKLSPGTAQRLRKELFIFKDLSKINPNGMTALIKEVEPNLWPIALRNASRELLMLIFSQMAERRAQQLKNEIQNLGPQSLSKVEQAQSKIMETAEALKQKGQIILANSDDPLV